ncbi:CHASE2 domain-containing protein [Nostoc sp. MS1]|uniref:CHASE2 domain-containing protein n=1 Tax=Nostoc sp. MS1 TaxID=2764711 RepID=UPI001CC6661A|nr:CHASE2 domain-containing protein [Nostoc sp. MS1]BCL35792.1 hypothetical protein NSMS1_22390 [Nostoc sp. MS1]
MTNVTHTQVSQAIEIFFSSSNSEKDEILRKELVKHLSTLEKDVEIISWYESQVSAGKDTDDEIKQHLSSARIILLLISPDFIASDKLWERDVKIAMERHDATEARVIPVLLRKCLWQRKPLNRPIQTLPKDGNFIKSLSNEDEAFTEVAQGIKETIDEISRLTKKSLDQLHPPETPTTKTTPQENSQTKEKKNWLKAIHWYGVRNVVVSSMWVSFLIIFVRFFGLLEPSEFWLFDNMMRYKLPEDQDENILIIQVTSEDISNQGSDPRQGSLTDKTLLNILNKLLKNKENIRPKVVGIDIYRDFETKNQELSEFLKDNKNNPIFGICYVGDETQQNRYGVKPPPELPNNRVGFSDFLPDRDGIVRRHILRMGDKQTSSLCRTNPDRKPIKNAFSLNLALHFLDQSEQEAFKNETDLKINNTSFEALYSDYRSGYSMFADFDGYQILLNYRIHCESGATCSPENFAKKVTIADVLKDDFITRYGEFIKDKIVLIGVTDSTYEAPWTTPLYSKSHRQVPGVIIQAQMVSQIINAVLEKRPLLQVWPIWLDISWIFAWSLIGGTLFQNYSTNRKWTVVGIITLFTIPFSCYMVFIIPMIWIPCIPPILSFLSTGGFVLFIKLKSSKPRKF